MKSIFKGTVAILKWRIMENMRKNALPRKKLHAHKKKYRNSGTTFIVNEY